MIVYTLGVAGILAAVALAAGYLVPRGIVSASSFARSRVAGGLLAALCAVWAGRHGLLMMEGGMSRYHNFAISLLALIAVLCLFYLDHLPVRAAGGVVLLCINAALHEAFVAQVAGRGVFAAVCYVLALVAMVLIGMPWLFRLALEKTAADARWRGATSAVFGGAAAFLVVLLLVVA
jgi:hypothetical protein